MKSDAASSPAKDKIIVALDAPDEPAALRLAESLSGAVGLYKIGLELFTRYGPGIIERVRTAGGGGCGIFLDLKFHDIPNTVLGAVRSAATLNVEMLTVHLSGGRAMLQAAATGARTDPRLLLLGVSVLTSSDADTLRETGVSAVSVEEQVLRLARLGVESGLGGVVASPKEIAALRGAFEKMRIVTPGVRPAWAAGADDQRRVMTPGEAVRAGADYLVIGRPITGQADPRAAAGRIAGEIRAALSETALP